MRSPVRWIVEHIKDTSKVERLKGYIALCGAIASIVGLMFQIYSRLEGSQPTPKNTAPPAGAEPGEARGSDQLPSRIEYLNCETPGEVYSYLRDEAEDFREAFDELYSEKWIPPDCWFMQVARPGPDWSPSKKKWKVNLVARSSGLPIEVWSGRGVDFSAWRPGVCAELKGQIVEITTLGRFVVHSATLIKSSDPRCEQ